MIASSRMLSSSASSPLQNFLKQQIALQAEKEKAAAGEAAGAGPSGAQSVELDEWLVSVRNNDLVS